jgi:anti-sigma B factor antagonist
VPPTLREPTDSAPGAPRLRDRVRAHPVSLGGVLFDVRTLRHGHWSVLAVVGEVDLATMPALRQELDQLDGDRVALDLASVDYLEPVALGLIVAGSLRARRRDARFSVVCPPGAARDLLEESGVDRIVEVVGTLDDLA